MKLFQPDLIYFEPQALEYPLGKELYDRYKNTDIPVRMTTSHNRITDLPGKNDMEKYRIAKKTLVVGVRKTLKFEPSKPSTPVCHSLGNRVYGSLSLLLSSNNNRQPALYPGLC
jgi:hypothetical protein